MPTRDASASRHLLALIFLVLCIPPSLRYGRVSKAKRNKDIPASPHVQVPEYVRWQEGGWRFFYEQAQRTLAAFIPHARNFVLCLSIFDDRSKNPMQQLQDLLDQAIELTDNGNIFFTGTFYDTFDSDPGAGIANLFGLGGDDYGIFVLKLDNDGDFVWSQAFNNPASAERGSFITTDNTGNIYVIGEFSETTDLGGFSETDFATGICSTGELTAIGNRDLVLIKLNPTSVPATCFGVIEQPVSTVACQDGTVFLSAFSAATSRITYQWQKFNGSVFVDIADQEAM